MIKKIDYSKYFKIISKNLQNFDYTKIESVRKKISSLNKGNKIILEWTAFLIKINMPCITTKKLIPIDFL